MGEDHKLRRMSNDNATRRCSLVLARVRHFRHLYFILGSASSANMLSFLKAAVVLTLVYLTSASPSPVRRQSTTLKAAAEPRYFGAALGAGHLSNASDPNFALFAKVQYSGATPENEMKW